MLLNPLTGLREAIAIGVSLSITTLILTFAWDLKRGRLTRLGPVDILFDLLTKLLPAVALGLVAFCATFAALNPILQFDLLGYEALADDLTTGTITLRVVSFLLAWRISKLALHYLLDEERGVGAVSFASLEDTHLGAKVKRALLPYRWREFGDVGKLRDVIDCKSRDMVNLAQYGIFLTSLTLLWTFSALDVDSLLVIYLNLTLFFFVDDWAIISDYFVAFKGRMLRPHRGRIWLANTMLMPGLVVAAFLHLHLAMAVLYLVVTILLLFWRIFAWGVAAGLDALLEDVGWRH
jgi:hypothetical protein